MRKFLKIPVSSFCRARAMKRKETLQKCGVREMLTFAKLSGVLASEYLSSHKELATVIGQISIG